MSKLINLFNFKGKFDQEDDIQKLVLAADDSTDCKYCISADRQGGGHFYRNVATDIFIFIIGKASLTLTRLIRNSLLLLVSKYECLKEALS
ncbi:hypothetical protein Ccrd_004559 [Cynara cardunculus var. scolymus]|uniref:Uncharacterized protein n=1 Tax=Cynara cardunculus var. scolymus TaxID=59895 RepID=A0A118JVQ5_CYNCS|nr:hypothetical protein Ccrd_004559 [Cynara cardunculus var. scolymus]